MNSHIATQVVLANATKWSEEIAQTRPHAFDHIGVDFKDIVVIVVSCPFLDAMSDRGMHALDASVGFKFISEDMAIRQGKAMDMSYQGSGLCSVNHLQANLSTRTSNRAQ
jgi:hypothetical protein